jgi:predicted nucleotidyltransferase
MKWGLKDSIVEQLKDTFKKYPVEKVVLFGSRARGTNSATADIDLAVYASRMTHRQLSQLSDELEETEMIYLFDLVHIDETVNTQLIANIEKEGQVIYGE